MNSKKLKSTYNHTKIIATIGPSSNTEEMIKKLAEAGVDVFRLNFSHGKQEDHLKVIEIIRKLNHEWGTTIAIVQDIQGPKIRVNEVEPGVEIKPNDIITITTKEVLGTAKKISTSYENLPNDVRPGDIILIDDGKLQMVVQKITGVEVECKVLYGGPLKSRKGINLPNTKISTPSLTEKDISDIEFGLKHKVDWIALSFVRKPSDIEILRDIISRQKSSTRIIAKIEKPEALENIDAIIEATDAVMVARGDLGIEIWMEEVPMVQKKIIEKCNQLAKPVIVATQMMESMIENPRPTRAETNDVANAVLDGADAVMLSAETASGKYPLEVIHSMVRTIEAVEKSGKVFNRYYPTMDKEKSLQDSLIISACQLANSLNAKAIVGMTQIGYNAYRTSSHRPNAKIFAFTENRNVINSMNLVWGTRAFHYDKSDSTDHTISDVEKILKESGELKSGDVFVFLASMPISERGKTNMIKIHTVQ